MKTTITAHLHYLKFTWEEKGEYELFTCKFKDDENRTYIGELQLEIDVPDDYDPRAQQIAALEKQKQQVMADSQKTITEIDGKISNLKALEYTA
jgi:GH35 family endo-1,4-beta-xylanase